MRLLWKLDVKKRMKNKYVFTAVLLCVLTVLSLGIMQFAKGSQRQENETVIVTSFYPIYIATLNLTDGIKNVRVESLTPPATGCLHDYQLSAKDMKLLSEADAFVINGAGMESFLEDVMKQFPDLQIITSSDHIELLDSLPSEHTHEEDRNHEHGEEHEHEHEHGEYNAHIWMDMDRYSVQLDNIKEGLIHVDAENAITYENNDSIYKEKINSLKKEAEALSQQPNKIIVFHAAFAYFADMLHYTIQESIDMDENASLSAAQIGRVIDWVKEDNVQMLFAEERYGVKLGEAVAKETNGQVLFLDTLVDGADNKDAYLDGMRNNLSLLKEVLR